MRHSELEPEKQYYVENLGLSINNGRVAAVTAAGGGSGTVAGLAINMRAG